MTKILLVEDDKSLREIYGVRLLAEGYDIVSAGDGEEALAMAIKERPALIVSDVMMPKISGFDMLDILRSTTETKDIKVIMMTALSSEDQRQRGERLGADRYLVKSQVGIEDVVRTVHEVLGDLPGMTPATPQPVAAPQQPMPDIGRPDIASLSPQPQPVTQPQQMAQPAPQQPSPQPVAAPQPAVSQQPHVLPQPTAPFSSSTPRPTGLGDRVLQPLQSADSSQDLAKMMEQELSGAPQPATQQPQPAAQAMPSAMPHAPQPQSAPSATIPQPASTMPAQTEGSAPQQQPPQPSGFGNPQPPTQPNA